MFNYKYLSKKHLKGFNNYKYSAIDTSPLSKYVMHPIWNTIVKFIPNWVSPNLLTFSGFLCMVADVVLLSVYDYQMYSSGAPAGYKELNFGGIPNCVYIICGVLLFIAYNLDGVDGKQARKLGVSGPLGEMFDHGLDSYIVFFIPFCLFSIFGRDEFSVSTFRGYLAVTSVVLNFYVSHWEKYNTGTLYLPWGYDVSMWVSSILFIITGIYGPGIFKFYVFDNITFAQVVEVAIHGTGIFTTLPIAVYNVYLAQRNGTAKKYTLLGSLKPIWPMLTLVTIMTTWAVKSPNDVIETDVRCFLLLFGTLFSNVASRLIVAEICDQRCEVINWQFWPLASCIAISLYRPQIELPVLYSLTIFTILAHIHYGVCVVRQICDYFKISCFTVPKMKRK